MATTPIADVLARAMRETKPFIPMYIHLLVSALFPIYTGAHASLSRPSSAAKSEKDKKAASDDDEEEDEEKVQQMEGLSNKDAVILPVTAGLVLAGLYFLIMRYGAKMINLILGWYFSGVGVYSVAKLVNDGLNVLLTFLFPTYYASNGHVWKANNSQQKVLRQKDPSQTRNNPLPPLLNAIPLTQAMRSTLWALRRISRQKYTFKGYVQTIVDIRANMTIINVFSALVGITTILYVNTVSKEWFLTNLQGFAVSYSALQIMSPTTFATGNLILGALFCYDIWAVFFTPLMVTVAKNLDQPIKLVFPRPDEPSKTPGEPPVKSFSMLGLGDIVLPGIMIGLALRFDLYMFYLKKQQKRRPTRSSSSSRSVSQDDVKKAPYVPVTGHWGDRFWTWRLPTSSLPAQLSTTFPKPYFTASMVGYVVGMITTLGVMSVFQHAQPALLYLVPGVLISLWTTALMKGEVRHMWDFSEAVTGDQLEEGQDEPKDPDAAKQGEAEQKAPKGLFQRLWEEIWPAPQPMQPKESKDTKDPAVKNESKSLPAKSSAANSDVIVSFSISRFTGRQAKTASSSDSHATIAESSADQERSPSRSDSSEDAVVVTPVDLEESRSLGETSSPRYRTRSVRGRTSE